MPELNISTSGAVSPLPMSQEALEALPFPLSIYTCDGLYVGANDLVAQLFRVAKEALVGRFNLLNDPASQADGMRELFHAAVAGQRVQAPRGFYDFSFPGTEATANPGCWVESTLMPFRDAAGQVTHVGMLIQDVTAQVAFEREAMMFKTLVEHASDGISISNPAGRITYSNPAYQALTGYGAATNGMAVAEIHPEAFASQDADMALLVERGQLRSQMPTRRADGSSFPADVAAFLLRDGMGQPIGSAAILRDLSEDRARDQELRLSKLSLDRSPDTIHWIDSDSKIVYVNEGACAALGYTRDELLSMGIADIDPAFPMQHWEGVWGQLKQRGIMTLETIHRRKDGRTFPVDMVASFLEFEGREYASVIARDISERKRHESELRTFKAMVENTPDAVAIVDSSGAYQYVNPAYRSMLRAEGDLVGQQAMQFILEEDFPKVANVMANIAAQRSAFVQARYRRADGSIFPTASTTFHQETPDGGSQIIGFVRDISEQQRAAEESAAFQQQVIDAQQAALRELSTPLIPIADGVVAMPLIGSIDTSRAHQVIETLLHGVAEQRAHTTILDITGVPIVDTQVANALLRAARAVRLLGAQVILTGIRPEVAQTLVGLGVDLGGISTRSTLQSGIAEALRGPGQKDARR